MAFRNIIIENPANISVRNNSLVIKTDAERYFPVEDISALLIESRSSVITAAALSTLGQCGCTVFFCDEKHMPCAVMTPYNSHSRSLETLRKQLSLGEVKRKQLWQSIVKAKIINQSRALLYTGKSSEAAGVEVLVSRVKSGDTDNVEAVAARKYFPMMYGEGFTRSRETGVNSALNYGYSIIRGCVARNLTVYGFNPCLGLNHESGVNSFNLADDLMEPFRPAVDLMVSALSLEDDELLPAVKRNLFNVLNLDILIGGRHQTVSYAIELMVESFKRAVTDKESTMLLPELLELKQHTYE